MRRKEQKINNPANSDVYTTFESILQHVENQDMRSPEFLDLITSFNQMNSTSEDSSIVILLKALFTKIGKWGAPTVNVLTGLGGNSSMLDFDKIIEKIDNTDPDDLQNMIYEALDSAGIKYTKGNKESHSSKEYISLEEVLSELLTTIHSLHKD